MTYHDEVIAELRGEREVERQIEAAHVLVTSRLSRVEAARALIADRRLANAAEVV